MRMNISSERKKEENCVVGGWRKLKQIKTSGEENALGGLLIINKRALEEHGGPNCTELNCQAPLTLSNRAQQSKIKRIVKRKQSKTKQE